MIDFIPDATDEMRERWTKETMEHISRVRVHMNVLRLFLLERAADHDQSKLREPELSGYAAMSDDLRLLRYGSPEHQLALQRAAPVIQHHYQQNDHHPQHFPNGMEDMNLLQLMEMLADWKAASERTKGGSLKQSFEVNRERFGDSLLLRVLERTAQEVGWLDES